MVEMQLAHIIYRKCLPYNLTYTASSVNLIYQIRFVLLENAYLLFQLNMLINDPVIPILTSEL